MKRETKNVRVNIDGVYALYIPCLRKEKIKLRNFSQQTFILDEQEIPNCFVISERSTDHWWIGDEDELVVNLYLKAWEVRNCDFYLIQCDDEVFEMQFFSFDRLWDLTYLRSQIYDIPHIVYEALLEGAPEEIVFYDSIRKEYFYKTLCRY
jgi:hypothetical protein